MAKLQSIDRSQLTDRPWHRHPSCFFLRPIDRSIDRSQLPIDCGLTTLPASFLQPIDRSIDRSQLADQPQPCHPCYSFFCDWLIHYLSMSFMLSLSLLSSMLSVIVQSIDRSNNRLQPANRPRPRHLPAPFFVWSIDQTIDQSHLANRSRPCHLPALLLCDWLIDQTINCNQPIDGFLLWPIEVTIDPKPLSCEVSKNDK